MSGPGKKTEIAKEIAALVARHGDVSCPPFKDSEQEGDVYITSPPPQSFRLTSDGSTIMNREGVEKAEAEKARAVEKARATAAEEARAAAKERADAEAEERAKAEAQARAVAFDTVVDLNKKVDAAALFASELSNYYKELQKEVEVGLVNIRARAKAAKERADAEAEARAVAEKDIEKANAQKLEAENMKTLSDISASKLEARAKEAQEKAEAEKARADALEAQVKRLRAANAALNVELDEEKRARARAEQDTETAINSEAAAKAIADAEEKARVEAEERAKAEAKARAEAEERTKVAEASVMALQARAEVQKVSDDVKNKSAEQKGNNVSKEQRAPASQARYPAQAKCGSDGRSNAGPSTPRAEGRLNSGLSPYAASARSTASHNAGALTSRNEVLSHHAVQAKKAVLPSTPRAAGSLNSGLSPHTDRVRVAGSSTLISDVDNNTGSLRLEYALSLYGQLTPGDAGGQPSLGSWAAGTLYSGVQEQKFTMIL